MIQKKTPIRIAHLILTYTNPRQTERMIKRLQHKNFDFYIHVDKKLDLQPHLYLKELNNVYFISTRFDVKWAGYSTVEATFSCIKEIQATGKKYEFINFMSGQDYPLKPAQEIYNFFVKNRHKDFLSFRDYKNDWQEGMIRVNNYFLASYNFRGKNMLEKLINFVLPPKQLPNGLQPFGKSMFWMLHPETAMFVVNYVERDKQLKRFFKFSWASDEFVFQTIILNSTYKKNVINNNYRYIDWSGGGANPKILDEHDFPALSQSEALFARKFDMLKKPQILNQLDKLILTDGSHP